MALTVNVELLVPPDVRVIEGELRDAVGPAGVKVVDNATAPLSPETLVRVIVAAREVPC